MSREFIIGAMDLTPYFVRTEREYYVFRDMPDDMEKSLVALATSINTARIAVYISPKLHFSTNLFTSHLHTRGLILTAHKLGQRFEFLLTSSKNTFWKLED